MPSKSFVTTVALVLSLPYACSTSPDHAATSASDVATGVGESSTGAASIVSSGAPPQTGTTASSNSSGSDGAQSPTATSGTQMGATSTGGTGEDNDELFLPDDLQITKLAGAGEGINLVALTLRRGPNSAELYAAVRNEGDTAACDPAVTFEFFDQAEQSLAAWVSGLYTTRLYQRSDDPSTLIGCLDPGETAMIGSAELPATVVVEELGSASYRFSYFSRDVLPFDLLLVDMLGVTQLERFATESGSAYTGTLENRLDLTLVMPRVTVFPLNAVGRPLGMATSSSTLDIVPGDSWSFETTAVSDPGADQAVYPGFDSVATP